VLFFSCSAYATSGRNGYIEGIAGFVLKDEKLMRAAADGDINAFGELVCRHQQYVWNIAWRLLKNPVEAEDATQDVFMKLLDAVPRYRPTAAFRTYLRCITIRLCLDRLEKKQPIYMDHLPQLVSPGAHPLDKIKQQESGVYVRRALDSLPPRQRTALILRYYEDLDYREIAQSMNTSVKSVERLLARGRKALANLLAGIYGK
jgi:RNA polymerase sigma-70 factor (ECF subfamily)